MMLMEAKADAIDNLRAVSFMVRGSVGIILEC